MVVSPLSSSPNIKLQTQTTATQRTTTAAQTKRLSTRLATHCILPHVSAVHQLALSVGLRSQRRTIHSARHGHHFLTLSTPIDASDQLAAVGDF